MMPCINKKAYKAAFSKQSTTVGGALENCTKIEGFVEYTKEAEKRPLCMFDLEITTFFKEIVR